MGSCTRPWLLRPPADDCVVDLGRHVAVRRWGARRAADAGACEPSRFTRPLAHGSPALRCAGRGLCGVAVQRGSHRWRGRIDGDAGRPFGVLLGTDPLGTCRAASKRKRLVVDCRRRDRGPWVDVQVLRPVPGRRHRVVASLRAQCAELVALLATVGGRCPGGGVLCAGGLLERGPRMGVLRQAVRPRRAAWLDVEVCG